MSSSAIFHHHQRQMAMHLSTRRRPRQRPTPIQWKSLAGISGSSDNTDTTDFTADYSIISRSTAPFDSSSSPARTPSPLPSRPTSPCISPRGKLAFLASRRSSKESQKSQSTTATGGGGGGDRDTSPIPTRTATPSPRTSYKLKKRRQSNFLELPGKLVYFFG